MTLRARPRVKFPRRYNEALGGPIRGGLNIPYPCNFLTKYPVSHKFRSQISRKLKYLLRYIL